ncbi:MAG: nitroreductase family protein [Lachnospiraceae bacterium]|nr:nitroreductase family protein [Lachnospiraceae bacterium]
MNEMLQTIMERRSIRKYNEKPVTEEQLSDILEALPGITGIGLQLPVRRYEALAKMQVEYEEDVEIAGR